MYRLTIKHADGTTYWTEHFNDRASAEKWVAEEQQRPYWPDGATYTIDDPPAESPEQKKEREDREAKEQARRERKGTYKARLGKAKTLDAVKEILLEIVEDMETGK